MPRETQLFFEEVLGKNLSLLEFVDSDWTHAQRAARGALWHSWRRGERLPQSESAPAALIAAA